LSDAKDFRQAAGHRKDVPNELAKATLNPHRVEAGDALVIEPNDFNSPVRLPSDQTVQSDGTIDMGAYGRLQVAGRSVPEIERQAQSLILHHETLKQQHRLASHNGNGPPPEQNLDYGINVRLVNQESAMFYVLGEVNAPGSYPLTGHETVLDALIAAGGLAGKANEHKLILSRPRTPEQPRVILPICYHQIVQLGETTTNYQLQPGDRIYVPSLTLWEDIKQSFGDEKSCPHCLEFSQSRN
jgi:polysaccharide biosynthesis/export protein